MNLATALEYARPGEEWTLDGDDYTGLTWLSDTPKPTQKALETAYPLAVAAKEAAEAEHLATIQAARDHALGLGFTNAMIDLMYPTLDEFVSPQIEEAPSE